MFYLVFFLSLVKLAYIAIAIIFEQKLLNVPNC